MYWNNQFKDIIINNKSVDVSMDDTINNNQNHNIWISETGESIHVTNDSNGIINRNIYYWLSKVW